MKIFDGEYGSKIVKVNITIDVWVGDDDEGIPFNTPEKVMNALNNESRINLGEMVLNNLETASIVNDEEHGNQ